MANKFVINENELVLGDVEFHIDLPGDSKKVIGGGRFYVNEALYGNTVFFYSSSCDFGKVTKEQFDSALTNSSLSPAWDGYKIIFSTHESFGDVLKENQLI